MPAVEMLFDALLLLCMVVLAWQGVHARNMFRAVVSFMMFGLLTAVAWVRLEAPDIALAEASLGAGLTGVLLLATLGRLAPERRRPRPRQAMTLTVLPWLALGLAGTWVLLAVTLALPAPGLGEAVFAAMPEAGVDSPVTAVLLNFRAWDTLLEIAVMLLAVIGLWSLGQDVLASPSTLPAPSLPALVRLLFPLFLLSTFYLLWRGGHGPGGAFPAGALLAAGLVLALLAGARVPRRMTGAPMRWALGAGLLTFLIVAVGVMGYGEAFFAYPPEHASLLIAVVEIAAGLSIGVMLTALFLGGEPTDSRSERR
ncbi:MAG: DUF4040 domain-containing protein [Gammaproteobacteria bacterium]|nr:DUF4040 domain-containing protein [Gammaproteobacteria bacterium]